MVLLVSTAIAMAAFMVAIALDLGGAVGILIFLAILLVGATLHAWKPLVDWLRGPAANQ